MASHDLYITVFSPEGRLHQIEYAFKAIKECNRTSIGIRSDDTVVVCTQKLIEDRFVNPQTVSNIYKITPNVGVMITGRDGDGQAWIQSLKNKAFEFLEEYGTQITSDVLAQYAASIAQLYTQKYSMWAYAVELMFFSYDNEKKALLFKIDPAGHFAGYFGTTSGIKDQEAESLLEKQYKQFNGFSKLNKEELIRLAIKTLQNTVGQDFKKTDIEITTVDKESQIVIKLKEHEIEQYLLQVQRVD